MSICAFETSVRLKEAGLPQPQPKVWQLVWAYEDLCVVSMVFQDGKIELIRPMMRDIEFTQDQFNRLATFAPSLEDITALLPEGDWHLEMWGGRHSCRLDTWQNLIRTQADNFTEAAALLWLELNKNAPPSDFSKGSASVV